MALPIDIPNFSLSEPLFTLPHFSLPFFSLPAPTFSHKYLPLSSLLLSCLPPFLLPQPVLPLQPGKQGAEMPVPRSYFKHNIPARRFLWSVYAGGSSAGPNALGIIEFPMDLFHIQPVQFTWRFIPLGVGSLLPGATQEHGRIVPMSAWDQKHCPALETWTTQKQKHLFPSSSLTLCVTERT